SVVPLGDFFSSFFAKNLMWGGHKIQCLGPPWVVLRTTFGGSIFVSTPGSILISGEALSECFEKG
ncbi:hypothetical protein, partial [Klebsiella pneumoniae]|uniref:hypothetical protein n=1 Tax=Klebsiella pneumoniae TaxID=573 RepID=UPI0030134732